MMIEVAKRIKGAYRVMALLCGLGVGSWSLTTTAAVACGAHPTAKASSGLQISQAWSPPAPPAVGVHAGYFTMVNHTKTPLVIVGATSPVYEQIDMHRTTISNGIASMQAVHALPVAPGEQVAFAPGGLHLMMLSAKDQRIAGERFPITLHLQNGATYTFEMTVKTLDMGGHATTPATDHSLPKAHHRHGN
jgi:copper(I)-binding protein